MLPASKGGDPWEQGDRDLHQETSVGASVVGWRVGAVVSDVPVGTGGDDGLPGVTAAGHRWLQSASNEQGSTHRWGTDMRIVDVDAHLHEPLDWVARSDPSLAEVIGPPARFMEIAGDIFGVADRSLASLPEAQQPRDRWDLIPPGFVQHLEMTDERQPEDHGDRHDPRHGTEGRLAWCDERGIDVQFLNPTFLVGAIVQVARAGRHDLIRAVQQAWNRWAMEAVDGHIDRLVPVTQIDLHDIEWSVAEMTRMREAGSRAFVIPEAPVGGRGRDEDGNRPLGRSISHPDFEPIWSAAEDLGMAAFAHVGFARERINPGWANNGADSLLTFNVLNMLVGSQVGPQLLLASLVLDGVLERHPGLVVVAEEVGIDWLPHLVNTLELGIGRVPDALRDGEFRPGNLERGAYRLPLSPTEYLQRQVRVSPLPASQPIAGVMQQVPPELLAFCSDYPHVEGTDDAVEICERQLDGVDEAARRAFFSGAGDLIGI